jgi:ketosteroid isomerase-like protein
LTTLNDCAKDEAQIRTNIKERVQAVRQKNADALLSSYSIDVATFDVVPPLENDGLVAVRKRVVDWFASFESDIEYEQRDLELCVSGEVAFEHHLTHVRGTNKSGAKVDMWFRETVGYRKIAGQWKITHQHSSVPFDPKDGKARLDLEP